MSAPGLEQETGFSRSCLRKLEVVARTRGDKRHDAKSSRFRRIQVEPRCRRIDVPAVAFGFAYQLLITQLTDLSEDTPRGISENAFALAGIDRVAVGVKGMPGRLDRLRNSRLDPYGTAMFIDSICRVDTFRRVHPEAIAKIAIMDVDNQGAVLVSHIGGWSGGTVAGAIAAFRSRVVPANISCPARRLVAEEAAGRELQTEVQARTRIDCKPKDMARRRSKFAMPRIGWL